MPSRSNTHIRSFSNRTAPRPLLDRVSLSRIGNCSDCEIEIARKLLHQRVCWAIKKCHEITNAAIELVHHSRKTYGAEVTVEDARGASAVVFATRDARAINTMTKQEAENAGVVNRRLHFRCESGKANLAPPAAKADWFQLMSVPLGNGDSATIDNGDKVAVVAPWQYPNMLAGVTSDLTVAAFAKIRAGEYRENPHPT